MIASSSAIGAVRRPFKLWTTSRADSLLLALVLLTLLAGIWLGHPFWHDDSLGVPITLDRIAWLTVLLGTVFITVRRGVTFTRIARGDLFLAVLVAYLGALAVMQFSSEHTGAAARWVFYYFMPASLYFALRQIHLSSSAERGILLVLGCVGVCLSLTGLFEVFGLRSLIYPAYIMDRSVSGEFLGRARGPLLNPIINGFIMIVAWAAWVFLGRSAPRRWWPGLVLVHGIMAVGVISTLTRSVWLAAGLAGLFLGYHLVPGGYRRAWLATAGFGLIVMALVVKGFFWEMKRDQGLSPAEAARSAQLRPILALVAWEMAKDHPFFGVGLGQYDRAKTKYLANPLASYPVHWAKPYTQHNVFLSILVETGAIGLMVFLFLLAAWTRDMCSAVSQGNLVFPLMAIVAIVAYVTNGLFHDVSIIPQMHTVLFVTLGLAESSADSR
ncbi:MAG TPA: O-antigen ligase family protein [Thermogutta sp.]|nr:O-antigen ligase family protein [Thermogutta sp.]HOP78503.1 O-antigen ligase family protein [Thermogutta sp.]HPU07522.1 O-antigen ligase family protein [Thermogutta sp.]HQF15191.1 O-antigen ligase family protein [Thermogutta sp.]